MNEAMNAVEVTGSDTDDRRADIVWPLAIFLTALALRVTHVVELRETAFFDLNTLAGTDMHTYVTWAREILGGDWVGEDAFYRAPLYPYFLAVLLRLSGGSLFFVCIVQAVIGALSAAAVYAAARQVLAPRYAAIASALLALYEAPVFFTSVVHSTTLEVFCASLTLLTLMLAVRRVSPPRWALLGACLGATCLVRPNFLLLAPLLCLPLAISLRAPERLPGWPRGKRAAGVAVAFLLCFLVVVLPVAVRNTILSGRLIIVSSSGGETFRLANSYDSEVFNFTYPVEDPMPVLSAAFWVHQGKKALGFWTAWEVPQNVNIYLCRRYSRTLCLPLVTFLLIGPPSLVGMYLGLQRLRDLIGAYLFVGGYYASIVPFFIISRFRLPVVPALAVLASLALWRILDLWRNGRRAHACLAVAAALLLGAAATFPRNVRRIPPNDFDNVAKAAAARNDTAEAIYLLRRSLSLRPRQHLNLYMLGALLAKEGRADEAIRYLEEAVRVRPDDPRPYRTLGLVYAREKKDPARALEWLGLYTKRETDPERRAHIEGLARSLRASLKGRPDS